MKNALLLKVNKVEILKFVANGIFATVVHYSVLNFDIYIFKIPSAGAANFIAAIFGITTSFLGNRYFVFKGHTEKIATQSVKFLILYAILALLHGIVLYIWTDLYHLDFRFGFVLATGLQVLFSYLGNKLLVFKNA